MAEPIRVCVLSDADAIWGSERSILVLGPHLVERGIELSLAAPDGEFAAAARELGWLYRRLDLPARGGPRTGRVPGVFRDSLGIPAGVARIRRATTGADVVHSNNLLVHPDAVIAGRIARRPTVIELHDIVLPGAPALALSASAALATSVVSISRATARCVTGPGRRHLVTVPQGIDTARFHPGAPPSQRRASWHQGDAPFVVGMVGRIDPEKGIDRLIRAAAMVGDVAVVIIGTPGGDDGSYRRKMRSLGEELLGDRITFAGASDDVPGDLRALDVLVNASDAEPFGLTVIEAQASGVAVLATRAGGIPDFVTNESTGLLVDPDDSEGFASALKRLTDVALRDRLTAAALESVREHHSVTGRADAMVRVYRRAMAR